MERIKQYVLKKIEIIVTTNKQDSHKIIHHYMDGSTATCNTTGLGIVDDVSGTIYQHQAKRDREVPIKNNQWINE